MKKNNYDFYKESKIFNIITKLLYNKTGSKCNFFYISSPGSSPSKVYMFKDNDNNMYAVKICKANLSRVSLYDEVDNLKKIYPFFETSST